MAILSGTGLAVEPAAKPETPFEAAKRLAGSSERQDRLRALALLKALGQPGAVQGDEALARYGELCLAFHAEGEKNALSEAKRAFTDLKEKAHSRWGLKATVGLLRVAAAEGRRQEAIRGLDRFLLTQGKDDAFIEAAWHLGCLYAESQDDLGQLQLARRALDYALRLLAAQKDYYAGDLTEKHLRDRLHQVNGRIRELQTGRLRLLFEKAEAQKNARKYDEAVKLYGEVRQEEPGHDLAELSGLRICECHFLKGDLRGSVEKARAFVAEDPLGPYRGHAHLLIGDICLEQYFDVAAAEPSFRCILEPEKSPPGWVAEDRRRWLAARKGDEKVQPAAEAAGKTWQEVLADAHDRVGIIEYIRRRFDAAAGHFDASAKLRPVKGLEKEEGIGMAEVAELCRKKQMPLEEALLAQGDDRTRLVLFLGAVYMKGWKDYRAIDLFERVRRNEFKGATLDQQAFARARQGAGYHHWGEYDKAMAVYADFDNPPLSKSIYAADALLQKATATSKMGEPWQAMRLFEKCIAQYPGTFWGERAAYNRAFFAYCLEDPKVALRWCHFALRTYPNAEKTKRCKQWVDILEKKVAEGKP